MTPKPTTIYFKATNSLGVIPLPTPTDVDGDPIDVRIDVAPGLMTDGTNIMTFGTFAIRDTAYDVKITLTDTPENTDDTLTTVYDVQIFIVAELPALTPDQTEAKETATEVVDTSGATNPNEPTVTKADGTTVPESSLTETEKAKIEEEKVVEAKKEEAVKEVAQSEGVTKIFSGVADTSGSGNKSAADVIAET